MSQQRQFRACVFCGRPFDSGPGDVNTCRACMDRGINRPTDPEGHRPCGNPGCSVCQKKGIRP